MKRTYAAYLTILLVIVSKFLSAQTQVTFYTSMGTFVATMEDVKRPITVTNFVGLVNNKFYDGIIFHRVVAGFVIQGGDPTGTGSGGSGVTIVDELTPPVSHLQKTLGMAKTSAPNSATSQYFINLVNNTSLDANYSAFGTVITNFSVVQAIGNVPVNGNNKPITPVIMDSLRVTFTPTGIYDMGGNAENIEVFPNPISDESVVAITSHSNQTAQVVVYSQLGDIIYSGAQDLMEGMNYISLKSVNLNGIAEGMYYLTVQEGNSISQKKFIRVQ